MNLLLDACKMALEIVAGERIKNDAFPPKEELLIIHDKFVRKCEEKLEQAIDDTDPQHGRDVKSLAQYLDEYIEHEVELNNICAATALLYAYDSWRELLEQALDAYELTEGVVIQIIKKKRI